MKSVFLAIKIPHRFAELVYKSIRSLLSISHIHSLPFCVSFSHPTCFDSQPPRIMLRRRFCSHPKQSTSDRTLQLWLRGSIALLVQHLSNLSLRYTLTGPVLQLPGFPLRYGDVQRCRHGVHRPIVTSVLLLQLLLLL